MATPTLAATATVSAAAPRGDHYRFASETAGREVQGLILRDGNYWRVSDSRVMWRSRPQWHTFASPGRATARAPSGQIPNGAG